MKRYTLYKEIRDTVAEWGCDCEEHETTCPQCAAIENTRVLEKREAALLDALREIEAQAVCVAVTSPAEHARMLADIADRARAAIEKAGGAP